MKRRNFLKSVLLPGSALAATSALPTPAISKNIKELRMVTSWPKNFPGLGTAAQGVADRITALSDGRYVIKVYGGGELVSPLKCLDAIQEGAADLYHSGEYYYVGKSKAFGFFSAVPFGFTAMEMNGWLYQGGGQQLWDKLSAEFGAKAFACGNCGCQMGGWFKNKINSLEDLKGLKMRIPGLGGDVLRALGGTPVTLAGSELLPALQSGTIDATEWVGPWNDFAFGLYKVAKNYYYPGFHEPGTTLSFGVNLKLWESLSDTDKAIFANAAMAEDSNTLAEFTAKNSQALTELVDKKDVSLNRFPDSVFKGFGEASRDVLADVAKSDDITRQVYDSFMAFRKNVVPWMNISDKAYMEQRALVDF